MIEHFKKISKKEWLFVFFVSFIIIFFTTLPLGYGVIVGPENKDFTGIHFAVPNDWFVYYSYMEQVRQDNFLFDNLYTHEESLASLNIFWLLVGLFAKFFNLSNILAFNLVRIFLISILLIVAYFFISYLFEDRKKRKISLILLSFSSGLGFFLLGRIIKYPHNFENGQFNYPMDIWVPESNTFLTLLYSPHFILALILILLIFLFTLFFSENNRFYYSFLAGICAFFLFLFHPFHVLTIFLVIFLYLAALLFFEKKFIWPFFWHYAILCIFSLPPILYYLYLMKADWVMGVKAMQNNCFTTPFWITLFSYGLLLFFSFLGFYFLIKKKYFNHVEKRKKFTFILIWALSQFLIIYFPVNFQRRMSAGLHFPLVILTTIGLFGIYYIIKDKKNKLTVIAYNQRYLLLFILLVFFMASNIFSISVDLFIYFNKDENSYAYIDNDVVDAARWLKLTPFGSIIFNSANSIINIIPAYSGRKVYVGHGVETPFFSIKQQEVDWFFLKNRSEEIESAFLKKRNINYIFYSNLEKKIGKYNPDNKSYLKKVYSNKKVNIYLFQPL